MILTVAREIRKVPVPSLEGMTLDVAETTLENAGLKLGQVTEEAHQSVPEDRIISQDPTAFEEVERGTAVDVVVSSGPSIVIVPNVMCRSVESAMSELESLGLRGEVGDDVAPNLDCPNSPDLVAQQDPGPGAQAQPGSVVVLHQGLEPSPSPTDSPTPEP